MSSISRLIWACAAWRDSYLGPRSPLNLWARRKLRPSRLGVIWTSWLLLGNLFYMFFFLADWEPGDSTFKISACIAWELLYVAILVVSIRNLWRETWTWRSSLLFIAFTIIDGGFLFFLPESQESIGEFASFIFICKAPTFALFVWLARVACKSQSSEAAAHPSL
jgi:hypothetical protein